MLECVIVEGSFNADSFAAFINTLLDSMQPWPARNSVVIMDNCSIHKSDDVRQLIESRGMKLEFLPAYSPDFNPIELAFSLLKSRLQRVPLPEGGGDAAVYARLYGEVMSIGVADCCAFYEHCGYGWCVVFIHWFLIDWEG
ncbi:hypothetical protein ACEPAH_7347 [Sanghuangporus vaninii]